MYVCSSYSGQKHVLSLHTIRDAARSALSFGVESSKKLKKGSKSSSFVCSSYSGQKHVLSLHSTIRDAAKSALGFLELIAEINLLISI